MHKLFCLLAICLWAILSADTYKSPEQIQEELNIAEAQLKKAEAMFDPWYTGPLLTPSASMMPPGYANIQPYIFITQAYAAFNEDRHSISFENDAINCNPVFIAQTGVTDSLDTIILLQTQTNWQQGRSAGGFGDIQWGVGFLIQKQTLYIPKMKFSIQQSFPTGTYQQLRSDGLDATGSGAYQTSFSFAMTKILFWATPHPVSARIALAYKISQPLTVHGFNSYGGGYGTQGRVYPGSTFNADFGMEVSFDQHWVLANDFVYTATSSTSFHGNPGTTTPFGSTPATIGKGFSDNFSLAPAIEYNWNANLGVLAGVQFSVYGRNSSNFISTILSMVYTFPP